MDNTVKSLMDFIDVAEKSRKYPSNTASARRSAVRLFEPELNDQERESLETLKKNFDHIYQTVFTKLNKINMTAESLQTYKNRFLGLMKDYEKYGLNPTKMASWNRPVRKMSVNRAVKNGDELPLHPGSSHQGETEMSRFELPLRQNVKAIILVPSDITKSEVEKVRKYIEFLDSISQPDLENDKEAA